MMMPQPLKEVMVWNALYSTKYVVFSGLSSLTCARYSDHSKSFVRNMAQASGKSFKEEHTLGTSANVAFLLSKIDVSC